MQFVQDASSEPYLEFSKIREGIYDAPSDFIIKAGSLYEPFDDQLLRECGGPSISFPLARVYEALQKSDQGCDHIWALFELLFSVSRDTDIRTLCEVMPGVYQVPQDVVVVRMHRSPAVGGISYRLISREWHSECQRLFALPRRTQELMLAEIYGGLWIRHERENQTPILLEMKAMMQDWLQDTAFPNTEEGMLTRLVLKLGTSRETVSLGGSGPNRSSKHESAKSEPALVSKEQPAFPAAPRPGVSAKVSAPIRLHTVRILLPDGTHPMEDIKGNGLGDVVLDAVPLQGLGAQHQAQDDHGNTKNELQVDLAVDESGILRVLMRYGVVKFIPLSSDDPIVLQQSATDPGLKKALCYQRLHSKYLQEYEKRHDLAEVLGYEIHNSLKDWYDNCLRDISRRLKQLGYF
ncbi:hypothetical protein PENFLA_c096G07353 [Penicillium flavigenum]|uniref:Uncharacterized protein n=1 Tax=Penicillium flavigenum TaxID=254877 RepID=A0A1V6S874_9EURO|nr:hypothetical protein PENFLA_c096G07353 [Penicillium flavigenum]